VKKLRFLISLITEGNDFQQEQAATARAAARDLGVELEVVFADGDSITQSTQILKSIQADPVLRPAAVIVEAVGGTGLPQVARAASAVGIGWGLLNREADYILELRRSAKTPAFVVTSDHIEVGHIQARQLAAMLPDGGSVLHILGPTESAAAKDRKAGFEEACPKNVQALTVKGKWTEESSHNSVSTWLKLGGAAKTAIRAVVAQNDAMAIGARNAFEEIGDPKEREKWLSLPFTGCDGLAKTGQAWVRQGLLAATVITPPPAGLAVRLMTDALRGGAMVAERTVTVLESFPAIEKLPKL
jgi:ribose transport system substrate-binding protein